MSFALNHIRPLISHHNQISLHFPFSKSRNSIPTSSPCSELPRLDPLRSKPDTHGDGIPPEDVKILAKFKSRCNYIRVLEVSRKADHPFAGSRLLLLDGPGNIHSISFLFKSLTGTYFDVFATLPPILPPGPLEKDYSDRLFIHIGDALQAGVKDGFSGILVDLFSKGSVIPELQDPNTWKKLKKCLRRDGRVMVNVGGSCVEAEDSGREGKMAMEETLKAMKKVFGGKVLLLSLGYRKEDSSIALTGDLPNRESWKEALPRALRGYVDIFLAFVPFSQVDMFLRFRLLLSELSKFQQTLLRTKQLHALILKLRLSDDPFYATKIVRFYGMSGDFDYVCKVFDGCHHKSVFLWNSIIRAYARARRFNEAFSMFSGMLRGETRPDSFSYACVIRACCESSDVNRLRLFHGGVIVSGLGMDPTCNSALVMAYSKLGLVEEAGRAFSVISEPDLVMWNSMISGYSCCALITGYCQCGEYEKASYFFRKMMGTIKGRKVDPILIASVLAAAAQSANIGMGIELHGSVLRCGLESDVMISSALIDMYAKCGLLGSARRIFENMPKKNAVSYNTIIQGLGLYGLASESFRMFDEMLNAGLEPDSCTFSALLCACCHSGLLNDGRELFTRMEDEFHVRPKVEHYVYLVKLLGMAGEFEEAYQLIDSSPGPVDPGIWGALLSCCEVQGNSEMAEVAARKLFETGAEKGAYRVMLSKVYARDGRWSNVNELRDEMTDAGLRKMPGLSWIGGTGTYS
ncbi:hypothetical protein CRG98_020466 [Punica granatum]|uniref:Pentatricopeptide repeat-containing protein At1g64310 n=1 Tax=Punica granatum TaxID=22663 RepID=A0A2I0JT80_PUNGR|nr:hypothetical protein CRG98_020466 [Punica granatum]